MLRPWQRFTTAFLGVPGCLRPVFRIIAGHADGSAIAANITALFGFVDCNEKGIHT